LLGTGRRVGNANPSTGRTAGARAGAAAAAGGKGAGAKTAALPLEGLPNGMRGAPTGAGAGAGAGAVKLNPAKAFLGAGFPRPAGGTGAVLVSGRLGLRDRKKPFR
jgi:hypothetical protein